MTSSSFRSSRSIRRRSRCSSGFRWACSREKPASCFGSSKTTGASEAWWRAFQSLPLRAGDRVLSCRAEYNANAFALIQARAAGVEVDLVPDDDTGQVDLDALEAMMDDRVRLVTLTHIPTSGGLVNPAAAVGAIAKAQGAWYLLDACQSAGQRPLNVDELQCDFLALTGRKFLRGPRGTGALYVRGALLDDLDDPTFIDSHSADWIADGEYELHPGAERYELFESPVAARVGLGVAVRYALDLGLDAIAERSTTLGETLRRRLEEIGADVHDQGRDRCGIVVFSVPGTDARTLVTELRRRRIHTSVAQARSAMPDLGARGITTAVRASVHYYNTEDEIDAFIAALTDLR
ncbi:MAG: aminotransferase class V-fold PLP-dependent enzyme [Actinomycetota bacterium]